MSCVCVFNNNHLHGNDNNLFTAGRRGEFGRGGRRGRVRTPIAIFNRRETEPKHRQPLLVRCAYKSCKSTAAEDSSPKPTPPRPPPTRERAYFPGTATAAAAESWSGGPGRPRFVSRRNTATLQWLLLFAPFPEINYQRHIRARARAKSLRVRRPGERVYTILRARSTHARTRRIRIRKPCG